MKNTVFHFESFVLIVAITLFYSIPNAEGKRRGGSYGSSSHGGGGSFYSGGSSSYGVGGFGNNRGGNSYSGGDSSISGDGSSYGGSSWSRGGWSIGKTSGSSVSYSGSSSSYTGTSHLSGLSWPGTIQSNGYQYKSASSKKIFGVNNLDVASSNGKVGKFMDQKTGAQLSNKVRAF